MNDMFLWMRVPTPVPAKEVLSYSVVCHHRIPSVNPPSDLAHGQLDSCMKLQSTWEGIFDKFSSIPDDEADIINLDTGEIEVNNGHLESLPDSEL